MVALISNLNSNHLTYLYFTSRILREKGFWILKLSDPLIRYHYAIDVFWMKNVRCGFYNYYCCYCFYIIIILEMYINKIHTMWSC